MQGKQNKLKLNLYLGKTKFYFYWRYCNNINETDIAFLKSLWPNSLGDGLETHWDLPGSNSVGDMRSIQNKLFQHFHWCCSHVYVQKMYMLLAIVTISSKHEHWFHLLQHIFCENCVSLWFDREKTCPMCRAQITDDPEWRDGSTNPSLQWY